METLGQRIARIRRTRNLSQTELANQCGWENGQARIGNYERDKREPSLSDLRNLASALKVDLMDLVAGGEEDGTKASENAVTYSPSAQDYALIPQYSAQGAAGNGHLNDHIEVTGGLVFKRAWLARMSLRERHLHVIYVDGHSMEPTISDSDVVLVDESQTAPRDGRIYVIRKPDGEIIIKRLIQTVTGGWLIRSDNDDKRNYPDQPVSESEVEQIHIVGRVVWHGGAL